MGLAEFQVFRKDRTRNSGGVLILVSNNLKCSQVTMNQDPNVLYDILAIDIFAVNGSKCRVFCVYRPPSCCLRNTRLLMECISRYVNDVETFVICGDFNFPNMRWEPPISSDLVTSEFLDLLLEHGITQFVTCPTHSAGNILDLVLGSDEFLVSNLTVDAPLLADHFSVSFDLDFTVEQPKNQVVKQLSKCEDLSAFLMYIDWDIIFGTSQTIEDFWGEFKNVLLHGIDSQIPVKRVSGHPKQFFDLLPDTQNAKSEKKVVYDTFCQQPTPFWKNLLRFWTKKCADVVSRDRALHENHILQLADTNRFYSYVKKVLNRESVIPDLEVDNITYSDDTEKANCLNRFFCTVFTVSDGLVPRFGPRTEVEIHELFFSQQTVSVALRKLSSTYSSGDDNIPTIVLSKCSDFLIEPLCRLFTTCFETSRLPNDWLLANVTPIYKGSGSKKHPNNYRPVSLTSAVCKVMEICVKDAILKHLLDNNLLSKDQHGFLPKRSTLTELLECLNQWMTAIERGEFVDVMHIDQRKAFDSVDHKKLLLKCDRYGIKGKYHRFVRAFLSDRWQRVKVGSGYSEWARVTSGVPQGSVLGPLLFLIYINDMGDVLSSSEIKMYADDAKIFKCRKRGETTAVGLQRDLTSVQLWCNQWQMKMNASKCSLLQIGWNNQVKSQYLLGDAHASVVNCVQDLGILISGKLTFSEHCMSITSNASKRVGLNYRAFSSRDKDFMVGMFVTYIRPLLEHNSEIWSPLYIQDIDRIEGIQRKFTKRIKGLFHKSYNERLRICNLEWLELRRIKTDVTFVYKMIHSLVALHFDEYFKYAPVVGTRGNGMKLYPCFARRNVTFNFFCNRVINVWNALPNYVVSAPSLEVFKCRRDENVNLLHRFLRGRAPRNL